MNPEEAPLLKPTLRMAAMMLVPTLLFLGVLSAAALAVAPSSPRTDAPAAADDSKPNGAPADGEKSSTRGARASAKTPGKM